MRGPNALLDAEDNWHTAMGLSFLGERVVIRGKDLFTELRDMRWMELLLFSITGRYFSENEIKLFEGIWVLCTSYPDPRIWNNRVASLAGTVRSSATLAMSGGIALSEAEIYGGKPIIEIGEFLMRCQDILSNSQDASLKNIVRDELNNRRRIPGYGRPVAHNNDERIQPLLEYADELALSKGYFLSLVTDIEKILIDGRFRMQMNVLAPIAGLCLDMKLTYTEFHQYMILCFTAGMLPCFIDASQKRPGTFLPVRCNKVAYNGKEHRSW